MVLLVREGCHLCDTAQETIAAVLTEVGADPAADLSLIDIDADPAFARWGEQVPVTFVDGAQHDYWRVDRARLRAALTGPTGRAKGAPGGLFRGRRA